MIWLKSSLKCSPISIYAISRWKMKNHTKVIKLMFREKSCVRRYLFDGIELLKLAEILILGKTNVLIIMIQADLHISITSEEVKSHIELFSSSKCGRYDLQCTVAVTVISQFHKNKSQIWLSAGCFFRLDPADFTFWVSSTSVSVISLPFAQCSRVAWT